MKLARPVSPKNARSAAAPVTPDLFAALDDFLTGLILDRAPGDARPGLSDWLAPAPAPAAPKLRVRKRKAVLAAV